MPVIQCPTCKRSLNLKQMPTAPRIKCPGCANPITVSEAIAGAKSSGGSARPAQASGRGPLTPEDEGFNFAQIQFPAAGPAAVSTFQTGHQSLDVYQGPIPGDPLGDQMGGVEEEAIDTGGPSPGSSKGKGKLSRTALVAILGGTATLLVVAIVVGTLIAGGGAVEKGGSNSGAQVSE
ncbi:hypothetical protein SAMN06265222_101686 [Neorhodopirellula lusitana]|uniref:Zinc finger/thioredoxin putative domain-containing protein n=2 Tax=Neorhodopirellula lusitana TaxID=445327 RepID=A0ABY1PRD3_9BACT|nr:hypothetical protein SAMN06265222_101686 [Neorhodopirellula lusitana]